MRAGAGAEIHDVVGGLDRLLVVLDHDYAWLRKLVNVPNREREHFWQKMVALKPAVTPPARYARAVVDAMPDRKVKIAYARRTAGAGSLGRPRFVGTLQWHGAPIMREAKAVLPSAWTLVKGRGAQVPRCIEIATGAHRILTSGGQPQAVDALAQLEQLVKNAGSRMVIVPGGGIHAGNVGQIVQQTGVREIHASLGLSRRAFQKNSDPPSDSAKDEALRLSDWEAEVRKFKAAL